MKRTGILLGIALVVVLLLFFLRKSGVSGNSAEKIHAARHTETPETLNERGSSSPRKVLAQDAERGKLEDLIGRWDSLPAITRKSPTDFHELSAAHQALLKEAVQTFACTRELVDFQKFLDAREYAFGGSPIDAFVEKLFASPRAGEARANLVELVKGGGRANEGVYHPWIMMAGRTCPQEEIGSFCEGLERNDLIFDALGSYNSKLAETAPVEAMVSSLRQLQKGGGSPSYQPVFSSLISRLPPDADFAELERMFPDSDSGERGSLFSQWAETDPAAAANHIMADPERLPPDYMRGVADSALRKDVESAIEWVRTFPPGPYYDQAVVGMVYHLSEDHAEAALELAGRIQDEKLREEQVAEIKRLAEIYKRPGVHGN